MTRRRYVDSDTTPHGMLVRSPSCEHCDGEDSSLVRHDHLRGWVCPRCDAALDEMFGEGRRRQRRRRASDFAVGACVNGAAKGHY